ncbi:TPA: excisionase [Yersinia enterocolitica]|nr:excisionase [Yersinia enterocolitica]HEN3572108.1 excisionase [Yersinia enterocolitica]HEN3575199.1 excisionase [Yersinia enterocolitica]HEN3651735.1 excisionase [Yersinia enterocolitica]HEN3655100.1 excisionase [Yersinia enterocolitica]
MAKLMTLTEWCDETYTTDKPTIQTLQRWARNGNFYPAAEKHGRQYRVRPGAIYIQPKSYRMAKALNISHSTIPPILEKMGHGKKAGKV